MKAEPHILFVSSWYPTVDTSQGTFVQMHLLALQSRGCRCAILLTSETTGANFLRSGLKKGKLLNYRKRPDVRVIENPVVHRYPLRLSKDPVHQRKQNILRSAEKKVQDYIREEGRPDFIFHHGIFDYCYLSEFLSRTFDLPIRYLENSPNIEKGNLPVANPFDTDASRIRFVQQAQKRYAATEAYVKKMEAVFETDFIHCPNVVTDDFFIDEPREKPRNVFRFVNVAILDARKNQKLLIEAFADKFAGNDHYRLVIAGDGPLKTELQALAAELGVEEQVDIPGFIDREEVVSLLDASHVFVLPSHAETFGVVVVEAMARGIPAITSDIPGTREIITPKNGLVFPPDDRAALGKALVRMVDKYEKYKARDIVDSVRTRFGPDASAKVLLDEF